MYTYKPLSLTESISFDSIRGLAAIVVAISHVVQIFILNHTKATPLVHIITALFSQGAVAVFFAMSGFMIAKSISNNTDRNNGFKATLYFKNRAIRIYPPLIFAFLLSLTLSLFTPLISASGSYETLLGHSFINNSAMQFNYRNWLGSLFFLNRFLTETPVHNSVLWTLSMEVWCYILAGFLFTKRKFYIFAALFLYFILFKSAKDFSLVSLTWTGGFITAYLHNRGFEKIDNKIAATILAAATTIMVFFSYRWIVTYNPHPILDFYRVGVGFSFAMIIFFLLKNNSMKINILPSSAKYSYTLYIVHFPIMVFIYMATERLNNSFICSLLIGTLSLFISILASKYASNYVENKQWIKKIMA